MDIKDINFAIEILSHPQSGDASDIKEAFKVAIESLKAWKEALEQEPCEDAISKKVVLDKIKEVCFSREKEWIDFRVSQGSNGQRDFIIDYIEQLPSVKPKEKLSGNEMRGYITEDDIDEFFQEARDCGKESN